MKARLKPGGTLTLAVAGKKTRLEPGDVIDAPQETLERYGHRFVFLDRPAPRARVMMPRVDQYEVSPGWYQVPGVSKKVRKAEAVAALKHQSEPPE